MRTGTSSRMSSSGLLPLLLTHVVLLSEPSFTGLGGPSLVFGLRRRRPTGIGRPNPKAKRSSGTSRSEAGGMPSSSALRGAASPKANVRNYDVETDLWKEKPNDEAVEKRKEKKAVPLISVSSSSTKQQRRADQPAPMHQEETYQILAKKKQTEEKALKKSSSLVTMHGCKCKASWAVGGRTFERCARAGWNSSAPFCYLEGPCADPNDPRGFTTDPFGLPGKTGDKWDYCAMPEDVSEYYTHQGCHCLPVWEFENASYHGCAYTAHFDTSQSWCYVADDEQGCKGATTPNTAPTERRAQRWDYCDGPAKAPAFLTKEGCHCAPSWDAGGGKRASSCVMKTEVPLPKTEASMALLDLQKEEEGRAALKDRMREQQQQQQQQQQQKSQQLSQQRDVSTLDSFSRSAFGSRSPEDVLGWCFTFQDDRGCPGALKAGSVVAGAGGARPFDTCFLLDEATVAEVHPTLNRCHCMPEWDWDEGTFRGCAKTPGTEKPWCMVLEDARVCTRAQVTLVKKGAAARRWDYCDLDWGKVKEIYRPADQRFTAKENRPPQWYQHWYQDFYKKTMGEEVPVDE